MSDTVDIVVCPNCDGKGIVESRGLVDYHKNDYVYWATECKTCSGSGMVKRIVSIRYEAHRPAAPYGTPVR